MSNTIINPGESSNGLIVGSYDNLIVSGGTAVDTNVNGGGMSVFLADGLASNTTVTSGGTLYASGATLQDTTLEGSALLSAYAAIVNGATVNSGGSLVGHGREFNNTVVNGGGRVDIYGGTVTDVTLHDSGRAYFANDGTTVNNLTIAGTSSYSYTVASATNRVVVNVADVKGGFLEVDGGASVNSVTLSSSGFLNLSGGNATAIAIDVNEGGCMYMEGNATASDVTVNSGGYFSAGFGGRGFYGDLSSIGAVVRENGGTVVLGSGNVSNYIEDETGGYYVSSAGVLYPVTFVSNTFSGLVYSDSKRGTVHSGTTAVDITAIHGGLTVYDGGIVTGFTATPHTFVSNYIETVWTSSFNEETQEWEYSHSEVPASETVTRVGGLTVIAGGTVTGLVAQALDGYDNGSYLDFQIAPDTVINGTIDGTEFALSQGIMSDVSIKDASLTYMDGASVQNITQTCGSATVLAGASVKGMVFSGTSVTFSSGAVADGIKTAPIPYSYYEYGFNFGDQEDEPEEILVEGTSGAYVTVSSGATVTGLDMDSLSYLHMQVAPNTVLQGTSGGVEIDLHDALFKDATLGSTYVEVFGSSSISDPTGAPVTVAGGTVSNLVVNNGAVVSAYDGATALEMVENGGAVWVGWDESQPTVTYSFVSNTFSSDYLKGDVTVHKNTIARDNIMYGGALTVFSGGVIENYYTVGSSTVHDSINIDLYDGATVTNLDMTRYSDPGHFHPRWVYMYGSLQADGMRLTDWDGFEFTFFNDTNIANGAVDNVPFSVVEGVVTGLYLVATDAPYWDRFSIEDGAAVTSSYFDTNGNVEFFDGAFGSGNLFARTSAYVHSGAVLENTTLGLAPVTETYYGETYTQRRAGNICVYSGGVMRDVTLTNNSEINLEGGAKLTGKVRAEDGQISVSEGTIVDFDLTAPGALYEVRMDNLMTLGNTPKFTITIDSQNQANGQYALTDKINLPYYSRTTFDLVDVSGSTLGYFTGYMDVTTIYGEDQETVLEYLPTFDVQYHAIEGTAQPQFNFSLSMVENEDDEGAIYKGLVFTVDGSVDAPGWLVAPTVTADVVAFTNTDVVLSVEYSKDAVTRQYSYDGQTWLTFGATEPATPALADDEEPKTIRMDDGTEITTATTRAVVIIVEEPETVTETLTVTANGTVFFRGISADGVVSDEVFYTVNNIDKTAPAAPEDLDDWTTEEEDGTITLTLGWSEATDDYSGIKGYKVTYWQTGAEAVTVSTAFTHFDIANAGETEWNWSVQSVDYAGNESEAVSIEVGVLTKPEVTASITDPTQEDVLVTAVFNPDAAANQYSLDEGQTWEDYPANGVPFTANGTVWFRSLDETGESSAIAKYEVSNIDREAPESPIAAASTTDPTNEDVLVTATFSNDTVLREFSRDGEKWEVYTEDGIVFEENGSVMFRGTDAAGNVSAVTTFTVENIDREAPDAPSVTADTFDPTNGIVTVTAEFSADSVVCEFSRDGENWEAYPEGGIAFEENGRVLFRAIDAAGNISQISSFSVENIDHEAPAAPVAGADITNLTNGTVLVTATFSDDTAVKEYSLDNENWETYPANGVVVDQNGFVYFRAKDAAGNESTASYEVRNIDNIAPTDPTDLSSSVDGANVTVSWTASSDDSGIAKYIVTYWQTGGEKSFAETTETSFTFAVEGEAALHWTVQAVDAAGNLSKAVNGSGDVPPDAPVAVADITELTKENVTVTATFAQNSVLNEYSLDGGKSWEVYPENGVVFDANGTVMFRSTDEIGCESDITTFTVGNIDKIPPEAPIAAASTTEATNENVLVTATFSNDTVTRQFSRDNENWEAYPENGVTLEENGDVFFRGIDAAGNVSDVTSLTVGNIDKEPPAAPSVVSVVEADTALGLLITAAFSEDSDLQQYSLDGGQTWQDYIGAVLVTEVGTVLFRGVDAAGNDAVFSYQVDSLVLGPAAPVAAADVTEPTNTDVLVTATFAENAVVNEYSLDGQTWEAYPEGGIQIAENTTVYFRSADAEGKYSQITAYSVENIDKVPPEAPVAFADVTEPTNTSVTVFATFSDDSVQRKYGIVRDGYETWYDYTDAGVVVEENDTVLFASVDAAGNGSAVTSFVVSNIDKVPPEAPTASVTAAPAADSILVVATFSEDSAVKQFSTDGGQTWQDYADGVLVTEVGTVVKFRGFDAAGNESDVTSYEVTSLSIGPAAPTVGASVTELTNDDVLVYAQFGEDTVTKQFSRDGQTWEVLETEGVALAENGTVWFRGLDADGNASEAISYTVTNIDKVPPAQPTITASTTEITHDEVLVTATFSEDSVTKEYSLDGHEWNAYTDPISFSLNGTVYFRATDAAGNVSETTYEVTNIAAENLPDNGLNDVAYNKKAKAWNDANITVENWISAKDQIVNLDVKGTVEKPVNNIVMHNMVGYNTPKADTGDAAYLYVDDPAKVTFSINANMAGTFFVYERVWDEKKHTDKLVQVGKAAVKAGTTAYLKDVGLSNSGEYFVQMDANSKAYKKAGATGYYDVRVSSYTPFVDADEGWNDDYSYEAVKVNPVALNRDTTIIGLDDGVETAADRNFVGGITDLADYAKLELESSAFVSFNVTADGASDGKAKFMVYKYDAKKNKLTKVLSSTLAPGKYTQTTKGVFFDKTVTYYLSMESMDGAKGKSVYYKVDVNSLGSRFFDSIDNGLNNELYDKKGKKLYADDGKTHHYVMNEISAGQQTVFLDSEPAGQDGYENYVGYGDKVDYAKFTVATNGTLTFNITAMHNATFEVYKFNSTKKKLESIGKAQLKLAKNATTCTGSITGLQLTAGEEYYMSMTASKVTANEKGCVYYDVKANFASAVSDAQLESALAAGAATGLESFQDDKSAWQDLTKLA